MDVPLNAQSSALLAVDELMATGPGKILHAWGRYVVQQKAYSCATPFFGSNKDIGSSNIAGLEAKPEEPTETKADLALIHNNVISEVWEVDEPVMSARQCAAKDDNATVPFATWDVPFWEYLMSLGHSQKFLRSRQVIQVKGRQVDLLSCLRDWLLRAWRRSVFLSFSRFMRSTHGHDWYTLRDSPDFLAGRDCVERVTMASFWDWDGGSRLLFWRWPIESRIWARDGLPIYFRGPSPAYRKSQPPEPDVLIKQQVREKLCKFTTRGYIRPGTVNSLISYFAVPKGETDICLVFDGTKSGLNAAIWAPTFTLPTVDSLLPCIEPGSWQGDIDVGEQFYNFFLDPSIRGYCGMDLHPYLGADRKTNGKRLTWQLWERCVMGIRSSPHGCVKMQSLAEEVVRGNPNQPANPFFFDVVHLNLPRSRDYTPMRAWVTKINSHTGSVANDMKTYVDNVRAVGSTQADCRQVCHRIGAVFCYLGIQDAL